MPLANFVCKAKPRGPPTSLRCCEEKTGTSTSVRNAADDFPFSHHLLRTFSKISGPQVSDHLWHRMFTGKNRCNMPTIGCLCLHQSNFRFFFATIQLSIISIVYKCWVKNKSPQPDSIINHQAFRQFSFGHLTNGFILCSISLLL